MEFLGQHMYSIQFKCGWLYQITLQEDHLWFALSPAMAEHISHSSIKQSCMKHQAGLFSLPLPPGQQQGQAITTPMSVRPGRHSSQMDGVCPVSSLLLWSSLYTALGHWPWKLLGGLRNSSLMQYLLWWGLRLEEGGWKIGKGILETLTCPSLSTVG